MLSSLASRMMLRSSRTSMLPHDHSRSLEPSSPSSSSSSSSLSSPPSLCDHIDLIMDILKDDEDEDNDIDDGNDGDNDNDDENNSSDSGRNRNGHRITGAGAHTITNNKSNNSTQSPTSTMDPSVVVCDKKGGHSSVDFGPRLPFDCFAGEGNDEEETTLTVTKKKKKKVVRFDTVAVQETIARYEYTATEFQDTWFTREEFQAIQHREYLLVSNSSSSSSSTPTNGMFMESLQKEQRRLTSKESVFLEQERQWYDEGEDMLDQYYYSATSHNGHQYMIHDDIAIAEVYLQVTHEACYLAYETARKNQHDVAMMWSNEESTSLELLD